MPGYCSPKQGWTQESGSILAVHTFKHLKYEHFSAPNKRKQCDNNFVFPDRSKPPDVCWQSSDVTLITVLLVQHFIEQGKFILSCALTFTVFLLTLSWGFSPLRLFQMSTTTENGLGGPLSTSREKTYKKVKQQQQQQSLGCLIQKMKVSLCINLFEKGCDFTLLSPQGLYFWACHIRPSRCPSTVQHSMSWL